MLILTILGFALLLGMAHHVSRGFLSPAELFAGTWLVSLLALLLSGDSFFPVSSAACIVYIMGGSAFVLGGNLALSATTSSSRTGSHYQPPSRSPATYKALVLMLPLLLVGLPFYWREMSGTVDQLELEVLLQGIRASQVERVDQASSFSILLNLGVLAQFTALAMYFESNGQSVRRGLATIAVVLALVYGAMSGTKGNAVTLLIGLVLISSLKQRRLKLSVLAAAMSLAFVLFSVGVLYVNLAYETHVDTRVLGLVIGTIQSYWLGGLVAFSSVVATPNTIASTQPPARFFLETARSLGFHIFVPPKHAQFTQINSYAETNVYTIYFSYFTELGWTGTLIIMFVLGALLTLLYNSALRGRPVALLLFAYLGAGIVLSVFAEYFFQVLNPLIKFCIFLFVFYKLAPAVLLNRVSRYA